MYQLGLFLGGESGVFLFQRFFRLDLQEQVGVQLVVEGVQILFGGRVGQDVFAVFLARIQAAHQAHGGEELNAADPGRNVLVESKVGYAHRGARYGGQNEDVDQNEHQATACATFATFALVFWLFAAIFGRHDKG